MEPSLPEGAVNPRGPWLRSNIFGKRVNENRDRRFNSNPMQSTSGGQFSPIPKSMIEMMAKMKLEEDTKAQTHSAENTSNPPKDSTNSTATNLHQQTPTAIKRKFLKTQEATQITNETPINNSIKNSMVRLAEKANQGQ
jgi:hypothetical protein